MASCVIKTQKITNMQEPIDELLEWLHTFDDLQFSCNHRNVIEKIWQIKSKQQFAIHSVVGRSEQLNCPYCGSSNIQQKTKSDDECKDCGKTWAV